MDHSTSLPPDSTLDRPPLGSWRLRRRGTPVDELPDELRHVRVDMLRWAVRNGRWVGASSLTVLLRAKLEMEGPFMRWTADDVRDLLEIEVIPWCEAMGMAPPDDLAVTLWAMLDYFGLVGFARGSEPLSILHAPLLAYGLTRQGRPRRSSVPARPDPRRDAPSSSPLRRHPSSQGPH
jgi:hypothetical protein